MKVESTFILSFALTASSESKIQLKGGFTFQHLALASGAGATGLKAGTAFKLTVARPSSKAGKFQLKGDSTVQHPVALDEPDVVGRLVEGAVVLAVIVAVVVVVLAAACRDQSAQTKHEKIGDPSPVHRCLLCVGHVSAPR